MASPVTTNELAQTLINTWNSLTRLNRSQKQIFPTSLLTEDFNTIYAQRISTYPKNKLIFKKERLVISNPRTARFLPLFKIVQQGAQSSVSDLNSFEGSEIHLLNLHISFHFTRPIQLPFYRESYVLRFILLREYDRMNPSLGPRIDEILNLEQLQVGSEILAFQKVDSMSNYQILLDKIVQVPEEATQAIEREGMSFTLAPAYMKFENPYVLSQNAVNGQLYYTIIKYTILELVSSTDLIKENRHLSSTKTGDEKSKRRRRKTSYISKPLDEKEFQKREMQILNFQPEYNYPQIDSLVRAVFLNN